MEQRPKVLIVEDEAVFAYTMREVLNLVGFEVVGVAATVTEISPRATGRRQSGRLHIWKSR